MKLGADTLQEWLKDFESFNYDFRRYCFEVFRAFDVKADFIPNVLRHIHGQWVADCKTWLTEECHANTSELSHVKILALLLYNLNKESFLGNMYPHEYNDEAGYKFRGTEKQRLEARTDLVDAREHILALDFCILVAAWFEENRIDRDEPFCNRMTVDMRHDLISYLLGDNPDRKSIYLILKALFLRKGAGTAL